MAVDDAQDTCHLLVLYFDNSRSISWRDIPLEEALDMVATVEKMGPPFRIEDESGGTLIVPEHVRYMRWTIYE